jgi:hypothetical protein
MADSNPQVDTVEDAMSSLFAESIFDLPTLVRQTVAAIQQEAGAQDAPGDYDLFIHPTYVYVRSQ